MYSSDLLDSFHANVRNIAGRPLIIDSFAGGGGASTGIHMALGRSPDIAINHNAAALSLHEANHPGTLHLSQNIYHVDPLDHVRGAHIGLAWFSPDCKHFSKAKGGKPVERHIRDLAHVIPYWVDRIQHSGGRIDVVIMENVEEFSTWGPLIETTAGLMPCPDRKGETFQKWCRRLRSLGGKIQKRELRGCDYGAPTIRRRLFVVIRFDGQPIEWPEPMYGAPDDPDVIAGRKQPWKTAASDVIDWSIACPSIFDSAYAIKERYGVRAIRPLADNTMARIARGMKRYVLDAERPFLVSIAHGDSGGRREYPVDDPFGVVTAGGISHAVVSPSVIRFNSGATGQDCREPLSTVTANSLIKRPGGAAPLGVIAPNLMSMKGSDRRDRAADAPHPTVLAGGGHSAIIAPVLSYAQQGGRSRDVADPVHTITASDKDQNQVLAATLVGCGGRAGQSRPRGSDEPTATITAKADTCVAAAFIAQHNNDSRRLGGVNPGRGAGEPLSTVTATGAQQGVVAPFLQKYYGTGDGSQHDEPCHTVTTKDRHGHVEATLSAPPFTPEMEARAREVAEFMREYGFWDDREFVTLTIGAAVFVIVDIGMRMLTPRELYNAQGFPPDYEIERGTDGHVFSKSVQVSCVGNSVCPPVAAALVKSNCSHLADVRMAA
jgi:DNA (cytosine-5)-methyltransferase 1